MSSSTPVGKRVKLSNDAAQSPLGMLAALASPSPPIRSRPQSLAGSLLGIAGNGSTPKVAYNSSIKALEVADTPSIDAGAYDMHTPKLESGFPERSQRPASPLYSPSTRAARRKTLRGSPDGSAAKEAADTLEQSASATSSASSVPARSPLRPGAIPATQLDVLALVTATSPPMPSRRRWAGHGTPKAAPARANDVMTPVSGLYATRGGKEGKGGSGSSSDTVSEDEDQLRSHSSRLRARYHSVQMRALPGTPPVVYRNSGVRSEHATGAYPTFYAQGQRPSLATPVRAQVGRKASDGESTTTDEEAFVQSRTPAVRRVPASSHRTQAAPPALPQNPASTGYAPLNGVAPASEPALGWRTRPRMDARPFGVALSKQLAELTEETEELEDDAGGSRVIHQLRDLSASLSPLPSPSQPRRSHPRTKRMRARTNGQRPGSETETDNECDRAAQRGRGMEPRAERSLSTSSNDASMSTVGPASVGRQRRIIARPQYGAANSLAPYCPLDTNGGPAAFNGHMSPISGRDAQQLRLPPVTHLGGPPPRRGAARPPPPAPTGGDSGGETTETDDDFFDTSRSFHYSIRPPRRVVRQLASLRERNLHPAALDLHSQPSLIPSYQPHTAPVVGSGSGSSDSFGLGISGSGGSANRSASGLHAGPARIVSTPTPAAAASLALAVHEHRRQLPRPSLGSPGPPPIRQQPAAYQHATEQRANPMHNSSMSREFARDPFAPMPDEFTYKAAALRRLERSHHRGGAPGGDAPDSSANRKRALTAPSSYDPPLAKRSMHSHDANGGHVARARHSDVSSPELPNEHLPAPAEPRHQIGGRSSLLGESPVSSLRSSLFARAAPSLPVSMASSSASSSSSSLSGTRHLMHNDAPPRIVENSPPIAENISNPTMSSTRKRRHSSAATRHQLQSTTPPSVIKPIDESPTSSISSLDPATTRSPQSSDVLFPPIDSGSS